MKRRDSRKVSKWNWIGSGDNTALSEVNGFMELSGYGESIELEEGSKLCINWECEVPLYLDEEGYFDQTGKKTIKGSATVKKIINIGQNYIVLAMEGDQERQFLLRRGYLEIV